MAEGQKERSGGLSLQTLLISSAAAVAAATIVPLFWEQGTIIATAMTPVIVALVSEALRKPVERVSTVAPRVARRSGTGAALRRFDPDAARTRDPQRVGARGEGPERFEPLPPDRRDEAPAARGDDPYGLRGGDRRRPRLRIALVTGLLAFLAAAAVVTASELALFGGSVSGERGRTTIFGGEQRTSGDSDRSERERERTPTATPEEEATPQPSATPTPEPEETPPPSPTPTPVPTEAAPTPVPTP
jgi:hypothetical protein